MINRKNTILLAVLVNAGLLLILFITALTSKDEVAPMPTSTSSIAENPLPLFGEELTASSHPGTEIPLAESVAVTPAPVVHSLPPLDQPIPRAIAVETVPQVPVVTVKPTPAQAPVFKEIIVKKGESLEKIAKHHRTTVDEIIKLNQLSSSFLRLGQVIKVPTEKAVSASTAIVATTPVDKGADYYIVKVGDSPWTIAMKHHLKVEELLKLNGLNEQKARKLKPGDRLRIKKEGQ